MSYSNMFLARTLTNVCRIYLFHLAGHLESNASCAIHELWETLLRYLLPYLVRLKDSVPIS